MKAIKFSIFTIIVLSINAVAAEPSGNTQSSQLNSRATQSKANVQRAPVIGSMLEDGREVPARFQGIESKEQKARREREEQEQRGSEKE